MVFKKETEGDVTSVKDAKIAVYSCPFDGMITETKVCGPRGLGIRGEGWRLASQAVTGPCRSEGGFFSVGDSVIVRHCGSCSVLKSGVCSLSQQFKSKC